MHNAKVAIGWDFLRRYSTIIVDTNGIRKKLLYQGPLNTLVRQVKVASSTSSMATVILAPVLLHYLGADSWSWLSNLFFLGGVSATSLGQHWWTGRILRKYVLYAHKVLDTTKADADGSNLGLKPDDLIELETMDWIGRVKKTAYFVRDLKVISPGLVEVRTNQSHLYMVPDLPSTAPDLSNLLKKHPQ